MQTLDVGVVGLGRLGTFHLRKYLTMPGVCVVGVVEPDDEQYARAIDAAAPAPPGAAGPHAAALPRFADCAALAAHVQAVSVCTPTVAHHEVARVFLERGVATLVEKPLAKTLDEARALVALAEARGAVLQVGHVERFNPGLAALLAHVDRPGFAEVHRLSPYPFRSLDIGVVLDLMIHDLDILLFLVAAPIERVEAIGVPVLTPGYEDIASARVLFANGCVANLTASRVSLSPMRKFRIFCPHAYLSLDLAGKKAIVYKKAPELTVERMLAELDPGKPFDPSAVSFRNLLTIEEIAIAEEDALQKELEAFVAAARGTAACLVPGSHGLRAMQAAEQVLGAIRAHAARFPALGALDGGR